MIHAHSCSFNTTWLLLRMTTNLQFETTNPAMRSSKLSINTHGWILSVLNTVVNRPGALFIKSAVVYTLAVCLPEQVYVGGHDVWCARVTATSTACSLHYEHSSNKLALDARRHNTGRGGRLYVPTRTYTIINRYFQEAFVGSDSDGNRARSRSPL